MSTEESTIEASPLDAMTAEWTGKLDERLAELEPLVREYDETEALKARLTGEGFRPSRARSPRPAERLRSGHRGRPAGSGKRASEVLAILNETPGIGTTEIALKMGMDSANYLYRVTQQLVDAGKIRKDGNSFFPIVETVDAA